MTWKSQHLRVVPTTLYTYHSREKSFKYNVSFRTLNVTDWKQCFLGWRYLIFLFLQFALKSCKTDKFILINLFIVSIKIQFIFVKSFLIKILQTLLLYIAWFEGLSLLLLLCTFGKCAVTLTFPPRYFTFVRTYTAC